MNSNIYFATINGSKTPKNKEEAFLEAFSGLARNKKESYYIYKLVAVVGLGEAPVEVKYFDEEERREHA